MSNSGTRRNTGEIVRAILAGLILLGAGAPMGYAQPERRPGSPAVLGAALAKSPGFALVSARDARFAGVVAGSANGDTYDASGLVQDAGSAYYVDDLPDTHTFGMGEESAGLNLISSVDTGIVGTDFGPGVPDTNFLQVNYFTVDGSDIVPAGAISPDNLVFDTWRFDVGTTAAGTNKINWTPNPGFTVVDSGFCVADGGTVLGCFDLALNDSNANGVSGVGLVGLGGGDIAGYGVDEMIMYWEIQVAPSCGDGHVDAGEECDDGNNVSGDGCSAACQSEGASPADLDGDHDVDLADYAVFQRALTGPH